MSEIEQHLDRRLWQIGDINSPAELDPLGIGDKRFNNILGFSKLLKENSNATKANATNATE